MSFSCHDISTYLQPKIGIMRPAARAELSISYSLAQIDIPVASDDGKRDYIARRLINRVYGDIAQDFAKFVSALEARQVDLPDEAAQLRDKIRTKLAGDGPGERRHQAPPPR